jgi:acyl-CoA thioester hydrolase
MSDYKFFHPIEVRYGDLDPQGHVNNAKYLTYFEQARVHYLIELGLFSRDQSFMEIGVVIADIHIAYHAPTHYDDNIKVGVKTTKIGNKSLTVEQCVMGTDTEEIMAEGTVVMVAFDYRELKSIPVPENWKKKISGFEGLQEFSL